MPKRVTATLRCRPHVAGHRNGAVAAHGARVGARRRSGRRRARRCGWRTAARGPGSRARRRRGRVRVRASSQSRVAVSGPVHDEVGVALDAGRVRVVVVDAVGVEGERREAEQQRRSGDPRLDPRARRARARRRRARPWATARGTRCPGAPRRTPRRPGVTGVLDREQPEGAGGRPPCGRRRRERCSHATRRRSSRERRVRAAPARRPTCGSGTRPSRRAVPGGRRGRAARWGRRGGSTPSATAAGAAPSASTVGVGVERGGEARRRARPTPVPSRRSANPASARTGRRPSSLRGRDEAVVVQAADLGGGEAHHVGEHLVGVRAEQRRRWPGAPAARRGTAWATPA